MLNDSWNIPEVRTRKDNKDVTGSDLYKMQG